MAHQFTLLQHFMYNTGTIGDHCSYLIPNNRIEPTMVELLERINGNCSEDIDPSVWAQLDPFLDAQEDCKLGAFVSLPAGWTVTRICQIFYD